MIKNSIFNAKRITKYSIKKFSVGIVSVAIGSFIFLGGNASANDSVEKENNSPIANVSVETTDKVSELPTEQSSLESTEKATPDNKKEEDVLKKDNKVISEEKAAIGENSSPNSNEVENKEELNVLDKRSTDSTNLKELLTNIIDKNLKENQKDQAEEKVETPTPVEKGVKIISRLTTEYAEAISKGYIGLEGAKYDSLLYKNAVLNPDGDDDGDGILNKDELYIYKKDGRTYLGYDVHPKLADTDGDGFSDSEDKDKLIWNISARDMALLMNLVYEKDEFINDVLNEDKSVDSYKENKYKFMHNELAPFWKVKQTYHLDNGLDAVLFETKSKYPFLKDNTLQVLAIQGTNTGQGGDIKADAALVLGNESNQSIATKDLIKSFQNDKSITNLYITGHSLGGYLSLRATAEAEKNKYNAYKGTYTFNAPKIYSGLFNFFGGGDMKKESDLTDKLAQNGKVVNYFTDNDNIILSFLKPKYVKSIGKSAGQHSSTSYFETRVNNNKDFNFGKRVGVDGVGYIDPNLKKLQIISPEKGTLSETFLPVLNDEKPISIMLGEKVKDKDILSRVDKTKLPVNIELSLVGKVLLDTLGTKTAVVQVLYQDDNSTKKILVPIEVNEADKTQLLSAIKASEALLNNNVDLNTKTKETREQYNIAKEELSSKLQAALELSKNTLALKDVVNNFTVELANLGLNLINKTNLLELNQAAKYKPTLANSEKLIVKSGSKLDEKTVLAKIDTAALPTGTTLTLLDTEGKYEESTIRVKVSYADNTENIVEIPIEAFVDSKGESLVQPELPKLVISEKGESLVQPELPELVISEKGESLVQPELPELVISEKGESLVQPELPELVISEKGESLVQPELPELVISEKGESLVQPELPELVISEKGESLVQPELPELVISEKGESLVQPELPELVISEKGESLVQPELPEVELNKLLYSLDRKNKLVLEYSDVKNLEFQVSSVDNSDLVKELKNRLKLLNANVRLLDLKLQAEGKIINSSSPRVVTLSLLPTEKDNISIYYVDNNNLKKLNASILGRELSFNINHFSLFAIISENSYSEVQKPNNKYTIITTNNKETSNKQNFTLITKEEKVNKENTGKNNQNPQVLPNTGINEVDNNYLVLVIISIAGSLYLRKRVTK